MIKENYKGLTDMVMPRVAPIIKDVEGDWCRNSSLYTTEYKPLAERIAAERPALTEGLDKLRALMGEDKYKTLINPLINLARQDKTMLVIAKNHMQRSLIERDCVPMFKEAFGISNIRIVV